MAIPTVTFPIDQENISTEYKKVYAHLIQLQFEMRITQTMISAIRSFCVHPNQTKYTCPDCGESFGD